MSAPYEKQLAPANIYYAPIGEAFPDVDTVPAGNWLPLAIATDITEDGITINTNIQDARIFSLGGVAPVKAGIVRKEFTCDFNVMNNSASQLALANGADPADVVSSGGVDSFSMPASPVPQGWAIVIRWDQSSAGDGLSSQYLIESAVQVGAAGGKWSKSDPLAQAYSLVALYTGPTWVVLEEQTGVVS